MTRSYGSCQEVLVGPMGAVEAAPDCMICHQFDCYIDRNTYSSSEEIDILLKIHKRDGDSSCRLPSDGHLDVSQATYRKGDRAYPIRITSPSPDILLDPLQCLQLILEPQVGSSILCDLVTISEYQHQAQCDQKRKGLPEAKDTKSILNDHDNDWFLLHHELNPTALDSDIH